MELFHVSYSFPAVPKPLILLLHVIDIAGYSFFAILYYLGLYPSFHLIAIPWEDHRAALEAAQYSNSPLPRLEPSALKRRLASVKYEKLAENSGRPRSCDGQQPLCAICLNGFGEENEVVELGSCDHLFHKECIDRWIDTGNITCPLCRSEMLPAKAKGMVRPFLNLVERIWSRSCR